MPRRFIAHEPRPARVARSANPARERGSAGAAQPQPNHNAGISANPRAAGKPSEAAKAKEIGGPSGLEPTRYGDWERKGICVDF